MSKNFARVKKMTNIRYGKNKTKLYYSWLNQNWVLLGKILPWTWLGKARSGLVLVRNQKNYFQTQGVPVPCDLASALWLQQHSESAFFVTPCCIWLSNDIIRLKIVSSAHGKIIILGSRKEDMKKKRMHAVEESLIL